MANIENKGVGLNPVIYGTTPSPAQGPVSTSSVNTTHSICDLAPAMVRRYDTYHKDHVSFRLKP